MLRSRMNVANHEKELASRHRFRRDMIDVKEIPSKSKATKGMPVLSMEPISRAKSGTGDDQLG